MLKLANLLREKKLGIVAHFYMDAEVQGVLTAAKEFWPHIFISDSLVMADASVRMVNAGCEAVAVLGVDFMSENVRAILDDAGLHRIPVYRMSDQLIGCTLAEAAEDARYYAYLDRAATVPNSLHVVYINTSLRTKALADARVPTITCTSSNVLNTVLTAAAQVPDLTVWYGPDSFMGGNLVEMVTQLSELPDEDVAAVHPAHTAATLRALLPRLQYFRDGSCVVHELFAGDVVEAVQRSYGDAFLTAHFEASHLLCGALPAAAPQLAGGSDSFERTCRRSAASKVLPSCPSLFSLICTCMSLPYSPFLLPSHPIFPPSGAWGDVRPCDAGARLRDGGRGFHPEYPRFRPRAHPGGA